MVVVVPVSGVVGAGVVSGAVESGAGALWPEPSGGPPVPSCGQSRPSGRRRRTAGPGTAAVPVAVEPVDGAAGVAGSVVGAGWSSWRRDRRPSSRCRPRPSPRGRRRRRRARRTPPGWRSACWSVSWFLFTSSGGRLPRVNRPRARRPLRPRRRCAGTVCPDAVGAAPGRRASPAPGRGRRRVGTRPSGTRPA